MRHFLTLFLTFSLSVILAQETDWERLGLRGDVKSLIYTKYKNNSKDKFAEKGRIVEVKKMFFGSLGNLRRIEEYDAEEDLVGKYLYVYNDQNQIIKKTRIAGDLTESAKTTYSYNSENQLREINHISEGRFAYKLLYEYNKDGLLKTIYEYDIEGKQAAKTSYTYDRNGQMFSHEFYAVSPQREDFKITFDYNQEGKVFKTIKYNTDNSLNQITTTNYGTNSRIESICYEKFLTAYSNRCDAYNELGFIIDERSSNSVITYRYQYDKMTNWINKKAFSDGVGELYSIEAVLVYY